MIGADTWAETLEALRVEAERIRRMRSALNPPLAVLMLQARRAQLRRVHVQTRMRGVR